MKNKRNILLISILFITIAGCKDKTYKGTVILTGSISNYRNAQMALFEITQSQNYLISKINVSESGKFKLKFTAAEKSIYGITNGRSFIYFVNDVPELSIETSEDEFENYVVEDSPESAQLKELVTTNKKLATEVTLAEQLLISKMVKTSAKFGNNPEMLDLENKADKRSLEHRTYITGYMDTVHDKLLAIAASSFLLMNEDFNYLELFYNKLAHENVSKRQKEDLKKELDKMRSSFKSIASVTFIRAAGRNGKQKQVDSLQGKYVFINIWASWCYLSRTQIPFIKQAYEKFSNDANIEFINVAIDDDIGGWNLFLTKENYEMKNHLCDTLGKDAAILKRFGLDYIPANFLLDRNGNIITSNLRDDNLILTIDSVLKNDRPFEK